jgi:peptide/nickel transport system permease protein
MGQYTARRLLISIPLMFGIAAISFLVMQLAPGGPLALMAHNPRMTPAQLANIRSNLGLDKPPPVQFILWMKGLVRGDWGYSYVDGRPVLTVILERLPATLELMGAGFLISLVLAIPIGLISAVRQYSIVDYSATFFSFFALSLPIFWFGLMLQLLFSVKMGILPSAGRYDAQATSISTLDALKHLVLPACALGITSIAGWSRYLRSSLLEVIRMDYIRTARAKGLSGRVIVLKHAMRNALIPLVTVIALDVPGYFVGAVVIEDIFSWPGMGRLFVDSLNSRDYPVQMGLLVISAALIILGNLIADLAYGWLDPRVKLS